MEKCSLCDLKELFEQLLIMRDQFAIFLRQTNQQTEEQIKSHVANLANHLQIMKVELLRDQENNFNYHLTRIRNANNVKKPTKKKVIKKKRKIKR